MRQPNLTLEFLVSLRAILGKNFLGRERELLGALLAQLNLECAELQRLKPAKHRQEPSQRSPRPQYRQ